MKFVCAACGVEADDPKICSGCGTLLRPASYKNIFILEIVDLSATSLRKLPIVRERRGTFDTFNEAFDWWQSHMDAPEYVGCIGYVTMVEPATGVQS